MKNNCELQNEDLSSLFLSHVVISIVRSRCKCKMTKTGSTKTCEIKSKVT
jgi:hypothetical protein